MRRVGATVVVLLVAACGVRDDARPRPLAANEVPDDLLAPSTSSTLPEPAQEPSDAEALVYLVRDGLLVDAPRQLESNRLDAVIEALLQGATDSEAAEGLTSDIPPGTELIAIDSIDNDVISINLSEEFTEVAGDAELRAQAQLVYTAFQGGSEGGVLFEVEGEQREGVDDEGGQTARPLRIQDFLDFDPDPDADP